MPLRKHVGFGNKHRNSDQKRNRSGITKGLDDLVNLDVKDDNKKNQNESELEAKTNTKSFTTTKQKQQQKQNPLGKNIQQQQNKQEKNIEEDDEQDDENKDNNSNSNNNFTNMNSYLQTPPEARLPRWTFVFNNIFTQQQNISNNNNPILESLERIDRWKQMTASHGMLMRLRKIPAYIEATKVLVEATETDRQLENTKSQFWNDIIICSSSSSVVVDDDDENENDDDDFQNEDDDHAVNNENNKTSSAAFSPKNKNTSSSSSKCSSSSGATGQLSSSTLPMVYASAISRAVFEMTESNRRFSDQLSDKQTFRQRAQAISLPEELIEARNQIAHGRMPTLAQFRFATSVGLQYLYRCHWQQRADDLKEFREVEKNFNSEKNNNNNKNANNSSSQQQQKGFGFGGSSSSKRRTRSSTTEKEQSQQQEKPSSNQNTTATNDINKTPSSSSASSGQQQMLSLSELRNRVTELLKPK